MTDEERRKLCARLRSGAANPYELKAADEIERLAAKNKEQSRLLEEAVADASAGLIEAGQGSLVSKPSSEKAVEWRSTPAMRARIRELARPNRDDYDRAVIAVLDDFDNMLEKPL